MKHERRRRNKMITVEEKAWYEAKKAWYETVKAVNEAKKALNEARKARDEASKAWIEAYKALSKAKEAETCNKCGQIPGKQTGEYPCEVCGEPTLHDDKEEAEK